MWIEKPLPNGAIPIDLETYCRLRYQERPETIFAVVNVGIPKGQHCAEYREMQVVLVQPYNAGGYERHLVTFFDFQTGRTVCQDWHMGTLFVHYEPLVS